MVFRVQRLSEAPDPAVIMEGLPLDSPQIGDEELTGLGPTVETVYDSDLQIVSHAVEITYSGSYEASTRRPWRTDPPWTSTSVRSGAGSPPPWSASETCRFSFEPAQEA